MTNKKIKFVNEESVSKYFRELKNYELISHNDVIKLAKRIKENDSEAVDLLVKANLKFVITIAREYQGNGLPLSDLISEGNLGLIKAAYKYDHTLGFKFISYAVWWIRQTIIDSLNSNSRAVRLPINVINKLSKYRKEIEIFENINEYQPLTLDDDELDSVSTLVNFNISSLNEKISTSIDNNLDEGIERIDMLSEVNDIDETYLISDKIKSEINNVLSLLTKREREIIECYFGINKDYDNMTLQDIGDKYGLTKERVRQIKENTLRKIRNNSYDLFHLINKEE